MSETREYLEIPLEQLVPHPSQPLERNDIDDLAISIASAGLTEPIVVVPTGEPPVKYTIIAGHRRAAAVKKLKWQTIPAIVVNGVDDVVFTTKQLVASNVAREDFTTLQEAQVMQTMFELGISVEEIAKSTGEKAEKVNSLITIDQDIAPSVKQRFFNDPELTFDEAEALAEFAGTEDEAVLLDNIGEPQFDHVYQRARTDRQRRLLREAEAEALTEEGITVVDDPGYGESKVVDLIKIGISPDNHRSCDGHAAYIHVDWSGEEATRHYVCTDAKKYHDYKPAKHSPAQQADLDKAREGREFKKDGVAPTKVRREWLAEQLKNKERTWKGQYQWLAYVAAHRMYSTQKACFEILGLKPEKGDYGPSYPVARLLPKSEPLSLKTLMAMSFAGIDEELRLAQEIVCYRTTYVPAYLSFLKKNGYTLSLHEEQFLVVKEEESAS